MNTELRDHIRRDRLADDIWELVNIPSPTMREHDVAMRFAEMLRGAGAKVDIDPKIPDSPNVIGRLSGNRPGATLQLAGHLDHIDVDHAAPERSDTVISGRGSADMKSGLAGILEIVRILSQTGCDFAGEILVTAYGLHEAPLANGQGLLNLIDDGIKGDAAIVFEGSEDTAQVMGKGQSVWDIRIDRVGEVCHELRRAPEADALIETLSRLERALLDENAALSAAGHEYPLLGPQSIFIGQIHYGDFYNRVPREARLQGTRRWHPDRTYADVQKELGSLLSKIKRDTSISIEDTWFFVGESYSIDPNEMIVLSLMDAYTTLTGGIMPIAGGSSITDVNRIVPFAKIPAVPIGFDGELAHADFEYVRLDRVERGCRIAMQTAVNYLARGR
jgi:acetylornithine deacetylase/succinyl-diaminopimelate desuccinylase-like protein